MVKLQLALDTLCGDEALYLALSVAAHVDNLEADTLLIKAAQKISQRIRNIWPG